MVDVLGIGSLIGAGTGLLGGLFGGGGGISKKEQRNNFRWSVDMLRDFRNAQEASPEMQGLAELIQAFSKDPMTYSPEYAENAKARYAEDATKGAQGVLNQAWERAGAQGAYRDASTRKTERDTALRLGSDIAQNNRMVDTEARESRVKDLSQLGALIGALQNIRMQPLLAETQARLGAQVTQPSNPFGDLLQGLGTIGTAIGTSKVKGGGTVWGNLFGKVK